MSISDFDLEEEAQDATGEEGEDKKMEEMWSRKARRRSSQLKRLVGDLLELKDHPKVTLLLAKNGKRHDTQTHKTRRCKYGRAARGGAQLDSRVVDKVIEA